MTKCRIVGSESVGGVTFEHGFNEAQEFYEYRDAGDWGWGVFRNKLGGGGEYDETWFAYVTQPKGGPWMVLNTAGPNDAMFTRKGPLYDLDAYDYRALLGGLVPLIADGKWPQEIVTNKKED